MKNYKKTLELLSQKELRQAFLLLLLIIVMAVLDVIGVASIMPFMAVLANPEQIQTNTYLSAIYQTLGFTSSKDFLFFLGFVAFLLLVTSLAFKALTIYVQMRFTLTREYTIGKRLIEGYLHQPYTWFLERHSAELGKTILSEVAQVINGALIPMMVITAQGVACLGLLTLLFLVSPKVTLVVGLVLGSAYLLIYQKMKFYLSRIGSERLLANEDRYKAVSEAFGAVKELKVIGLEEVYINRFANPASIYARHLASAYVIGQLPRYALEAVAFGGMLLIALFLISEGSLETVLPILALYAFAGYRLMPALQQIYSSLSQLSFSGPALEALHADLKNLKIRKQSNFVSEELALEQEISLKNVQYTYPNSDKPVLKGINLNILANDTVGLVGTTGSGKTTIVDIILGLLAPQEGGLEIDGQLINESNLKKWQKTIGYVPQQIFLADDTVAANIAFGVAPNEIDQSSLERAAKIANLHEFVQKNLPQGYNTNVGERGVKLSGGQRQRIGISRALYHNPRVLIMDEATSALDNITEQAVMDAVNNLGHDITIILIAHRLSTVQLCNQIYLLDEGQIKEKGTYDELIIKSDIFRAMAQEAK